ncbi:helix-turn-helix domain-containing protein [Neobacillus vireti]|uniref:helix-turn-helix domain-containing protein n=1 Tax=Neobacillus vireti TaxID=220686 RepID=UPI003000F989
MIGKNIFEIRKKKGLTLSQLAERANISKSYLSNIERNLNQNPSIQVVKKIAFVLDVDIENLLNTGGIQNNQQFEDSEWIDFVNELKKSGIDKVELREYKSLIEFITWKNKNLREKR